MGVFIQPPFWASERTGACDVVRGVSRRTVEPALPLVDVEFFKQHSRISNENLDDAAVVLYLDSARSWIERYTARALLEQTWTYTIEAPPCYGQAIELPIAPLISVTAVTSYSATDVPTVMSAATEYFADTASDPGRILLREGALWPSSVRIYNALVVEYKAGYGTDPERVPLELRLAVCQLAAHAYENREASTAIALEEVPFGVRSFADPFRRMVV